MAKISAEKITFEFIDKIITDIGLKAELEVSEEKDQIVVNINGENLGALIGFHGETLESLQLLTTLVLNRKLQSEDWKRVIVDIGNWRVERTNNLKTMIENAVKEIKEQKLEKLTLPTMSASQRREVHLIVSENFPDYGSESEGEEPYRRTVLFKK